MTLSKPLHVIWGLHLFMESYPQHKPQSERQETEILIEVDLAIALHFLQHKHMSTDPHVAQQREAGAEARVPCVCLLLLSYMS